MKDSGTAEAVVLERQRGRVRLEHLDVRPVHPRRERGSQVRIQLDRGQALDLRAEHVGGDARPGPDLDDVVAEHHVAERPGQDLGLDDLALAVAQGITDDPEDGRSLAAVGRAVGYVNPSAFIAAFRRIVRRDAPGLLRAAAADPSDSR